jgi:hypothetical protein
VICIPEKGPPTELLFERFGIRPPDLNPRESIGLGSPEERPAPMPNYRSLFASTGVPPWALAEGPKERPMPVPDFASLHASIVPSWAL